MKHAIAISIVLSFFTIIFFHVSDLAADDGWVNLGLYGGQIYEIVIDPDDTDKMFAAGYYGEGLYRTVDGGNTWGPVLTGEEDGVLDGEATFRNTAVWRVKIAPSSDEDSSNNTIWAVHNYWAAKSTSGGADESWTHFSNGTMQDDCDNCPKDSTSTQPGSEQFRYCTALAIDPSDPLTVYVGTGGPYSSDKRGAVYKTTDGGSTWTKMGLDYPAFDPDTAFPDDPAVSYEPRDLEKEFYSKVVAIAVHPTDSRVVWAVDFNDVLGKYLCILYISTDGGLNWTHRVGLGAYMGESGLVVNPDEPNVVFMGTFWGIVRSEFELDNQGLIQSNSNVTLTFPIGWKSGRNIRALAFDPQNANILYASAGLTSDFKMLKSVDSGGSFPYEYNHDQQYIHLAPHPTNSNVIFGGDRLLGVFRGDYAASNYTWVKRNNGIHSIRINDIAIDPNDASHYLAGTMAGVYKQQGGQSNPWASTAPLDYTEAFSVEFDASDIDGASFFAGGESYLYKTIDHGSNWSKSNSLGYPHFVNDIAVDPVNANKVFITTRYPGKVYKSTNSGATLTKVLDSGDLYDFGAVAIDPINSTRIYAGGGNFYGADVPGNLFKSTTGGGSGSWSSILPAVTVNALLIDSEDPDIVYAGCGHSDGTEVPLYKSMDGGSTWRKSYAGMPGEPVRYGIWGSAADDLFVLKHTGSVPKGGEDDKEILRFSGRTWRNMDIGVSTPLYDIWGKNGSDVFAVGEDGNIVHYNGLGWSTMSSGTSVDLLGVGGSTVGAVYAAGRSGTLLQYVKGAWSPLDSGTHKDLNSVWSTSDGSHVFAVGAYGTVVHAAGSTNNWSIQPTGTINALHDVWGSSATNVFAVGDSGTILRFNGNKWTVMNSGTLENLTAVWGVTGGSPVFAVGDNGTILRYSGKGWTTMSSGTDASLYQVWGTTERHVYAVGQYGALLRFNGTTWYNVSVGFNEFPAWNAVTDLKFKVENGKRIIFASTARQGIYASYDGGSTWTHMSSPPYEVYALATGSVVVATQGGVLSMSGYGLIFGQVIDSQGAPISGATIDTDIGKSTKSASDGRWSIGLKAGTYDAKASIPGYGQVLEENVPVYDATGTYVGHVFDGRSIYVNIGNREVLGTGGGFTGPGGRITPTIGQFSWSQGSGNGELTALYGENATLLIEPDPGLHALVMVDGQPNGTSLIEFAPLIDSHTIGVTFENDPPVITGTFPSQTKDEDSAPWSLDLTVYESDREDSGPLLNWSVAGVDTALMSVVVSDIANDIILFTPVPDANGYDDIILTLTDSGGLIDSRAITVTLDSQDDPPVVSDIPDQGIAEGGVFDPINLDNYVTDKDENNSVEVMNWTYSGNDELTVNISGRVANVSTPHPNWNGSETITFTATDPQNLSGSDTATFLVSTDNDPPTITGTIPSQTKDEDAAAWSLDLSPYENDVEDSGADLVWGVSGVNTSLIAADITDVDEDVLTINPVPNAHGTDDIILTLRDSGGLTATQTVTVTLKAQNDAPVVNDIPNQTIFENGTFMPIYLDEYVLDVEGADTSISWTLNGNKDLHVEITDRVAYVSMPHTQWVGSETITFTAADSGQLVDSDAAIFTMSPYNLPPVAHAGGNASIVEGTTVTLNGSGSIDPDGSTLTYQWTQTDGIAVALSASTAPQPTFVTPPADEWGLTLMFQLMVRDSGGLEDTDEIIITIQDNGISGFPTEALTFTSKTGKNMGVTMADSAQLIYFDTIDPSSIDYTVNKPGNLIYGLMDLNIAVANPGDTATVTFHLEAPAPAGYKWFKYSTIKGWYDFSDHAVFNANRDQVTLTLVDGGVGDDDLTANSKIKDPSGLGLAQSAPPSSGSGGGGGGCFIASLSGY